MSLYDGIKDVAKVIQKADNIDLYKQLLDLGQQALDMQAEIAQLKEENTRLRELKVIDADLEFHQDAYVSKKSDTQKIKYCATCWASKQVLVPLQMQYNGGYKCNLCNARVEIYTR